MVKRIAIAWPGYTGYLGPCLAELARQCELRVYLEPSGYEQRFGADAMCGVPFRRVGTAEEISAAVAEIRASAPDLLLVCGWSTPLCRALGRADLTVGGCRPRRVLACDMPWEPTLRKFAARFLLAPRLRRFDAAFVPGRRAARYARWLGFDAARLVTGSNTSGYGRFAAPTAFPRGFLFVGRFASEKGLDVLLAAYAAYRSSVSEPWPLDLVGSGAALPPTLPEGVRVLGFVPPAEMPRIFAAHGALVLPSAWEPWGVCAAEAMSAGLATILTAACGVTDDLTPTAVVKTGDVAALAAALSDVAALDADARAREAARARAQAEPYSAAHWAARVLGLAEPPARLHVTGDRDPCNGMYALARLMAEREGAAVETCREFAARRNLDGLAEVVVHGCWLPRYWGACVKVLRVRRTRGAPRLVRMPHGSLDPVRLAYHGWKKRLAAPIERLLFARCDRVLVTGAWERDWCAAWGLRGPFATVDAKAFFDLAPKADGTPRAKGPLRILYLGRRHPLKGVGFLVEAAKGLSAELRLVSEHAGAALERDWAWCDVLCLPTLSENFGLVVAEALARGKRVVVTDGAPAWGPSETSGAPYASRVTWVEGFRDGTDRSRTERLAAALGNCVI